MSLVIPDDFLQTAHISEADLKLEIALLLFQQEKITLGTASQFAGMNQLELQRILGSRKIPIHYGVEDFRQDLNALEANGSDREQHQPTQTEVLKRIEQRRTFSPAQSHLPDTLTILQEDRAR
ncbi:MAG: toxin-antitoxin system antidote component [Phormidesmis priestleyi Ana]|uniref:Toxin-antitoxin system antidote component n=1 Tax=Phormidesmis priestleyi Ana TaxID=1666911 RepID=A0A0P7YS83_9CYAN|nr:MAG: toxin-antitoxin system antidote component [Phormidesmis priestleyi Ana]